MNVIEQAEKLMTAEDKCTGNAEGSEYRRVHRKMVDLLPDLVAECKRLEDEGQQADEMIRQLKTALRYKEGLLEEARAEAARS